MLTLNEVVRGNQIQTSEVDRAYSTDRDLLARLPDKPSLSAVRCDSRLPTAPRTCVVIRISIEDRHSVLIMFNLMKLNKC